MRDANSPVFVGTLLRARSMRIQRARASCSARSRSFSVRRSRHSRARNESFSRQYSTPFTSRRRSRMPAVSSLSGASERRFDALNARPLRALLRRAQRSDITLRLDRLQARVELIARMLVAFERVVGEQRVGARQAHGVRLLARIDHVVEGFHALAPAIERAPE